MRKKRYPGLLVFGLTMLLLAAAFWLRDSRDRRFQKVIQEQMVQVATEIEPLVAVTRRNLDGAYVYLVDDTESSLYDALVDQTLQNEALGEIFHFNGMVTIVYPKKTVTDFRDVITYVTRYKSYNVKFFSDVFEGEGELGRFYIKSDGTRFTLNDLVINKAGFKEALAAQLIQYPEARDDLTPLLTEEDWSHISFTIENKQLQIGETALSIEGFRPFLHNFFLLY